MLISQLSKALIAAPLLLITVRAGSQQDLDYASVYSEESLVTASDASVAHKMVLNKHVASYVKNYIKKNSENLEESQKESDSPSSHGRCIYQLWIAGGIKIPRGN
jgi:hypothetical protein